jgi:hypothetical protein
MTQQVSWNADLNAPSEACKCEHDGVPLVVSADDVDRAAAEIGKGLHEVVFNTVLITPKNGDVHYILGSVA